ncbi:MAG: hypothetical protein NQU41_05715 [Candidatus Methanosuratincola sp.]|uniref:Uncharacterized protein n=2 Tax=Candidatus Methanosuratincola (ex Vanwonterghem et al. 2016) TaxID=1915412 RepID=A0A7J3UZJ5_9CREN|nr:hypothetical protein [Candidatus Methanosuratincola sp.]RWX73625.1 MAG: hypothetical protein Metus_0404 [Candidatus Methanosuratincola subterraneus]
MASGYRKYGAILGLIVAGVGAVVTGYTIMDPSALGITGTLIGITGIAIGLIIAVAAWKVD